MSKTRITILGNSVPIRMRPKKTKDTELIYAEWIKKTGDFDVLNLAEAASIASDIQFKELKSNVFIINYGIVEASTRSINRRLYKIINQPTGSIKWHKKALFFIIKSLESKLRKRLVSLRGNSSWVSLNEFDRIISNMLSELSKNGSKIIVLGINKPSSRIEEQLSGTQKNVLMFNEFLSNHCKTHKYDFIDLHSLIDPEFLPDGIHYNAEGHRIVANHIIQLLY